MDSLSDEQHLLQNDAKYRGYVTAMERALKSFDNTNEWADLITALTKISKTISTNKKYSCVPHKTTVSKRLAQCLHQSLPAGVHLKALETYEVLFTTISEANLLLDYPIYSFGLLPLLSHAALSVKPLLLKLYEEHLIPLGEHLSPAASGFILGLLPGLEEGSEFIEWTSTLLDRLSESITVEVFYSHLWSCLLFNSSIRHVGTAYIISHVDKKRSLEDQLFLIGNDPSLLVQTLQTCLQDSSILVQRNSLDILSVMFPFHNSTLTHSDQVELLDSALLVLLRRDMSLNRRVYNWILGITVSGQPMVVPASKRDVDNGRNRRDSGSSSTSEPELEYFFAHSQKCVIESLTHLLSDLDPAILDTTKPLRIVISLLDRPEVGSAILEEIMIHVFRLLFNLVNIKPLRGHFTNSITQKLALSLQHNDGEKSSGETGMATSPLTEKVRNDTEKISHLFFSVLEPNFLWEYLADVYEQVLWPRPFRPSQPINMEEYCRLTSMILSLYLLESYPEIQTAYLPRLLNNTVKLTKDKLPEMPASDLVHVVQLFRLIVSHSLPAAPTRSSLAGDREQQSDPVTIQDSQSHISDILSHVLANLSCDDKDMDLITTSCLLLIEISVFPSYSLTNKTKISSHENVRKPPSDWLNELLKSATSESLTQDCKLISVSTLLDLLALSSLAEERVTSKENSASEESIQVLVTSVMNSSMVDTVRSQLQRIVCILWDMIDINNQKKNAECVYVLSQLLTQAQRHKVNVISNVIVGLTHRKLDVRVETVRKFAIFWHLMRETGEKCDLTSMTMVVLAGLHQDESQVVKELIVDWLNHSLECQDVFRLVEPCLIELLRADTSRLPLHQKQAAATDQPESAGLSKCEKEMADEINSASRKITSISSEGVVAVKNGETRRAARPPGSTSAKPVLISETGHTVTEGHSTELDSDRLTSWSRRGLAENPINSISEELDRLIFSGFTPHAALASKWRSSSEFPPSLPPSKTEDYNSIVQKAKRLDSETCLREGIDFSGGAMEGGMDDSRSWEDDHNFVDETQSSGAIPLGQESNEPPSPPTENFVENLPNAPPPLDDNSDEWDVDYDADLNPSCLSNPVSSTTSSSCTGSRESSKQTTPVHTSTGVSEAEAIVRSILDDIIDDLDTLGPRRGSKESAEDSVDGIFTEPCVEKSRSSSQSPASNEVSSNENQNANSSNPVDQHIHKFLLLYQQVYDTDRVQFSLNTLLAILNVSPKLFINCLTNTPCDSSSQSESTSVAFLLSRHAASTTGEDFYKQYTIDSRWRNSRLLEVIIVVALYFWKSYFPRTVYATSQQISANTEVQLKACKLLVNLLVQISTNLREFPRGFPQYMADIMSRCKLQKHIALYMQSLHWRALHKGDLQSGPLWSQDHGDLLYRSALLLAQTQSLVEICLQTSHSLSPQSPNSPTGSLFRRHLWQQDAFLSTVKSALSSKEVWLHQPWLTYLSHILPHLGDESTQLVRVTIRSVCQLLELAARKLANADLTGYPPDYLKQLLEAFTLFFHYCLVDNNTRLLIGQSVTDLGKSANASTVQIFSNLVSVFNPLAAAANQNSKKTDTDAPTAQQAQRGSRDLLLGMLPSVVAAIGSVWSSAVKIPASTPEFKINNSKILQLCTEFLSPIVHSHTEHFLGAIAVIWTDSQDSVNCKEIEMTLIRLLLDLKSLPSHTFISKLNAVFTRPPNTDHQGSNSKTVLQHSCLCLLKGYLENNKKIADSSVSSLLVLFKTSLQLNLPPNDVLLLLETLSIFVHKYGCVSDRKLQREVQEIVGKVLDVCCDIISMQLEASTWGIRKSYSVKVRTNIAEQSHQNGVSDTPGISISDSVEEHDSEQTTTALTLMATHTASLLDVVYPSEDKDKIPNILYNVLSRVFPYLRNHSLLNMRCFRASSQLLSSISSFQYSRKTWKREVYDMFLGDSFFKMDVESLQHWKVLIDTLLTHDKAVFKDLLARFTITTNSLPLFSNKEGEYETRSVNLRKLSFMILTGDADRYKLFLPEIQEKLAESIRLVQAPSVMCQVFLSLRILVLKMSHRTLLSLWSTINSELLLIMRQMEADLSLSEQDDPIRIQMARVTEFESSSSLTDSSFHTQPNWLKLYLSACKLLDLLLALPSSFIPEFQHYSWIYLGSEHGSAAPRQSTGSPMLFEAHVPKIAYMMKKKYGLYEPPVGEPPALILTQTHITSLSELQPFFYKLLHRRYTPLDTRAVVDQATKLVDNDLIDSLAY